MNIQTAAPSEVRFFQEDCVHGMEHRLRPASVSVVVTSPPYNIGKAYRAYDDERDSDAFLEWVGQVASGIKRVLEPHGSLFLNLGSKPSDPWWPMRIADQVRKAGLVLQNTILWVKSIAIEKRETGDYPAITGDISVGHYKPVNSRRFLNGLSEYIFHFTRSGEVELDKLGVGIPYQDKSNVKRWKSAGTDLHDRGNVWFIPYETIRRSRPHPCVFPIRLPEMCIRLHGVGKTRLVLDPFLGTGTTALAADRLGVDFVGFDIDPTYVDISERNLVRQREARIAYLRANPGASEIPWERVSLATSE